MSADDSGEKRRPSPSGQRPEGLEFEPETGSQAEALAELTARPAAPKSSLAFEPDEGDTLDRVSGGPARAEVAGPGATGAEAGTDARDEDVTSLIELAASSGQPRGSEGAVTAGTERAAAPRQRRKLTPAPRRADLSGDLEAELFGPKGPPRKGRHRPDVKADKTPAEAEGRSASPQEGGARRGGPGEAEAPRDERSGRLSVLVSDAALRKKKKKPTTARLLRSTRFAEQAIERRAVQVADAVRRVDSALRRVRLSLAGVLATAVIVAVALLVGVPIAWAGGILAMCLMLTLAGQPARDLIGYAGIIIAAAAIAEIIRQRERFFEIFMMFL